VPHPLHKRRGSAVRADIQQMNRLRASLMLDPDLPKKGVDEVVKHLDAVIAFLRPLLDG
jgi:hypothetical protein